MRQVNLLLSCLIVILFSLSSCKTKNSEDLIINKWKLEELTGGRTGLLPDSVRAEFINNSIIEFKKENQYYFTSTNSTQHHGTYLLSKDGKLLTSTIDETKRTSVNTIVELSDQKLVIMDTLGNKFTYTAIR